MAKEWDILPFPEKIKRFGEMLHHLSIDGHGPTMAQFDDGKLPYMPTSNTLMTQLGANWLHLVTAYGLLPQVTRVDLGHPPCDCPERRPITTFAIVDILHPGQHTNNGVVKLHQDHRQMILPMCETCWREHQELEEIHAKKLKERWQYTLPEGYSDPMGWDFENNVRSQEWYERQNS